MNAVTTDQITIQDQAASIAELEAERNKLRETVAELSTKVESMEDKDIFDVFKTSIADPNDIAERFEMYLPLANPIPLN